MPRHTRNAGPLVGGSGASEIALLGGWCTSEDKPSPHLHQLRFERRVEYLHRLGPRPVGELLREVADGADLNERLEVYAGLDADVVRALGGDRFPPLPIRRVA